MARKENLVTRGLSAKSRDFVKHTLSWVNGVLRYFYQIDPSLGSKLFPMNPGKNGYVVAKKSGLQVVDGQAVPPATLRLGPPDTEQWLESGRLDVARMSVLIEASGLSYQNAGRILDYGCSAGRMIRHLRDYLADTEIWGVDVASEHVFYKLVLQSKFYREYVAQKGLTFVLGRSLNSYVYFRTAYLKEKLNKWFELLRVEPRGYGQSQTVYLLRKHT